MPEQQTGEPKAPEIIHPKRILRVGNDFGIYTPGDTRFLLDTETPVDQDNILKVFQNSGYEIVRGGEFNSNNSLELGIAIDNPSDTEIAKALDLQMPPRRTAQEILSIDTPIVVKGLFADRGEYKYLLETKDQKAKFLTWLIASNRGKIYNVLNNDDITSSQKEILDLLTMAQKGTLTEKEYAEIDPYNQWAFEEYITTPSGNNTSYRVVADGYGNVHYAQLNVSDGRDKKMIDKGIYGHVPIFEKVKLGDEFRTLLTHPKSPLFLNAPKFVSNIVQGGSRILLNGDKVDDPEMRRVLQTHGINPDNPKAPDYVLQKSAQVATMNRGNYPYTGVDFMQANDTNIYYLEKNAAPQLNPEAIDLSAESPSEERSLAMMKKITSSE